MIRRKLNPNRTRHYLATWSHQLVECRKCQAVATVGNLCLYHWQEQLTLEQPYAHFSEEE
jgi:hypothetical protein